MFKKGCFYLFKAIRSRRYRANRLLLGLGGARKLRVDIDAVSSPHNNRTSTYVMTSSADAANATISNADPANGVNGRKRSDYKKDQQEREGSFEANGKAKKKKVSKACIFCKRSATYRLQKISGRC